MAPDQEDVRLRLFPLEEPITLPLRSSSGKQIKAKIIRAMVMQHSAVVSCNREFDRMIELTGELPYSR